MAVDLVGMCACLCLFSFGFRVTMGVLAIFPVVHALQDSSRMAPGLGESRRLSGWPPSRT